MPRLLVPEFKLRKYPFRTFRRRGHGAFLTAWMRSPLAIGAVIPSSRFLARTLARQIDVHRAGMVVELGAGTGVVTKALLEGGVKPERLIVVERDRRLAHLLHRHFPELKIIRGDAAKLSELLAKHHVHKINAIVSSLPLLSMPAQLYGGVVEQMLAVLPQDGVLLQYTYGPASPIERRILKREGVKGERLGKVWLNMPPAVVWKYERH